MRQRCPAYDDGLSLPLLRSRVVFPLNYRVPGFSKLEQREDVTSRVNRCRRRAGCVGSNPETCFLAARLNSINTVFSAASVFSIWSRMMTGLVV